MERDPNRYVDDASLITGLKEKDSRILNYLFDVYGPSLYGVIYRIVNHEKIAEEILQDTFYMVWEKAGIYDPKKMRLFTYMIAIARNLAKDHLNYYETNLLKEHDLVQSGVPFRQLFTNIHEKAMKDLLDKLSPEEREVVNSVIFAGCSHVETARQLNTPIGTIKNRLRAALLKFREIFQPSS